ncbi:MAG: hypothetical protein IJ716_10150 [Lachnospiraceae bacterium]|nr:hypothetical protein [Lachnospiraceae bacterium]
MANVQKGKLILDGYEFEVKDCSETAFFLFDDDEDDDDDERDAMTKTVSMDVCFEEGQFGKEKVSPSLIINEFATGKECIDDIIGMEFEVKDVEEADEREDTMYVFEHEPLVNYKLKILGRDGDIVHVKISGTAITDGYSDSEQTAEFEGEFWLICKE